MISFNNALGLFFVVLLSMIGHKLGTYFNNDTQSPPLGADTIIGAYWVNWSIYDSYGADESIDAIPTKYVNTVYYAFMDINKQGLIVSMDTNSDIKRGNLSKFGQLSIQRRVLSIGGGTYPQYKWDYAFKNPDNFVSSLQKYITKYNINGIDLDYEPTKPISNTNKAALLNLITKLRMKYPKILIQYDITANHDNINRFGRANWATLVANNVYINVMAYEMYGPRYWPKTALQSPLIGNQYPYTADSAIQALRANLVPSNRIILGIGAYGQGYIVGTKAGTKIGTKFISLPKGDKSRGIFTYKSIVKMNLMPIHVYFENMVVGTYSVVKKNLITYDDELSIREKAAYIISQGLAGAAVWEASMDAPITDSRSILRILGEEL